MAIEALTQATITGSLIDQLAGNLLTGSKDPVARPSGWKSDADWVRQCFIINTTVDNKAWLEKVDRQNRSFSSADIKWTDTSLGGNNWINPPPAFTFYADPPARGVVPDATDEITLGPVVGHVGMGPYYSEAIDDNAQIIHVRFGVAQFNSLTQFFTGFYSSAAGSAARTGRFTDGFINSFLRTATKVLSMALVPLVILPVAFLMMGQAARYMFNWPTSSFYNVKPSMPLYWNAVTSLVNQLGTNMGVITYVEERQGKQIMGTDYNFTSREVSVFNVLTDGALNRNGAIDVFKIMNRAKRMEMNYETMRARLFEQARPTGDDEVDNAAFAGIVQRSLSAAVTGGAQPYKNQAPSIESLLLRWIEQATPWSRPKNDEDADSAKNIEGDLRQSSDSSGKTYTKPKSVTDSFLNYFIADLADGSDWASFRVDYTGPVSESFSSNTAESSLAQKINSFTSSNHDIRMNFSGAAESIPGLSTVLDGVKTVLGTAAATLHLEGLAAVAGSSFVNIPQHWESSIAKLPTANYTIQLVSPYGNIISQMFNIYIPLAMLLAGALPLSTGKQSHTSPFLCELHDQGRVISRTTIIDSLSITRGTGNMGFNNEGRAMAIDVNVSFKDLSSIMALPIQPGFSDQPLAGLFDGENAFSDYLMAMSAMQLKDTIYRVPMLKYQARRTMANFQSFTSSAAIANMVAGWPGVNALSGIMKGTSR